MPSSSLDDTICSVTVQAHQVITGKYVARPPIAIHSMQRNRHAVAVLTSLPPS